MDRKVKLDFQDQGGRLGRMEQRENQETWVKKVKLDFQDQGGRLVRME